MKKLLSIVLAVCMMCTVSATSFAQTNNPESDIKEIAESLIKSAISDPNASLEAGSYTISNPIPAYRLAKGRLSKFVDAVYYVVFNNDVPTGIFTINAANTSTPTYSFSEDFVKGLDETILSDNLDYSLVVTENQVFAVTEDNAVEIVKYNLERMDMIGEINKSVIDSGKYVADEYEPSEVMSAISDTNLLNRTNSKNISSLSIPRSTRTLTGIPGVPTYTQKPKENSCWAVSSWCVGETLESKGYDVEYCVKYVGKVLGNSGNNVDQIKILSGVYGLNPRDYNTINNSQMMGLIDHGDPFILNCYTSGNGLGHSVTCYAYDDDFSPLKLAVMDSLVNEGASNWRWMTTSGTSYKITSAGTTYTYKYTTTPNGLY